VLHSAIILGSRMYHELEPLGPLYDGYLSSRLLDPQELSTTVSLEEMRSLRLFLNQWRTHYQTSPEEMLEAVTAVLPLLEQLQGEALLTVDLTSHSGGAAPVRLIEQAYDAIYRAGPRAEYTGTSKILHCLNPALFVMWDSSIRKGYGVGGSPASYAQVFMPKMQALARQAVAEVMLAKGVWVDEALRELCACGHSLAKVVDEFNYAKYTLGVDELRHGDSP